MGKGDNRRPEDIKRIDANWDEIDWGKKRKSGQEQAKEKAKEGRHCCAD